MLFHYHFPKPHAVKTLTMLTANNECVENIRCVATHFDIKEGLVNLSTLEMGSRNHALVVFV